MSQKMPKCPNKCQKYATMSVKVPKCPKKCQKFAKMSVKGQKCVKMSEKTVPKCAKCSNMSYFIQLHVTCQLH